MRIIIYEDDDKLRQSLTLLIDGMEDFAVVGAFPNCKNVEQEVASLRPEVVLMDITMPVVDGIQGVTLIKSKFPDIQVLMYTVFDDDEKLFASLKAGADGYLLKKTSPLVLLQSLNAIHAGDVPMSPGIARRVLQTFNEGKEYGLTKREKEILRLLTEGYTYKAISAECHISMNTVATHLRHVYEKLHVNCATEAVAKAIRERLV